MAVVTSDYLQGVLTNFRALFNTDFAAAQAVQGWAPLALRMDSNGALNTYTWFGTVPQMENVTHGQASRNGLNKYNFSITNEEFQAMIEVERAILERDQLNLITPRVNQLGQEAARHPGQLIMELFEDNPLCFSGEGTEAYFANTHTIGDAANVDNLLAGSGIDTVAHIQTDIAAGRAAIRTFQDDNGRPMNLIPTVLVVPVGAEQIFYQALNTNQGNGLDRGIVPATNNGVFAAGGYTILGNPYLTDVNDWYMMVSDGINKPFIYQVEKTPSVDASTNPNEQAVIESRKFLYSVYGRYNVGVTDPRFAVKFVNS